jgi:NAD(P)-dependent dehydrogenase (short-subunit alcohol dehydrogenase family)
MTRVERLGVVISGGAGDIGAAVAAELARSGARVTLIDRKRPSEAEAWLIDARRSGEVFYAPADVRDRAELTRVLAAIDPLDIAIGNAGIVESAPFLDVTEKQWHEHLEVNLTGCFNIGQIAAQLMVKRQRPGRIIFTGSWVGRVPWPGISAYSVSKAGLVMLAKSMASELASHRILVNVVAPGIVDAGLAKHQLETDPKYADRVARAVPLGRLQSPQQVASVVAFLCSEASDYITGATILADGGCSLFQFD